MRRSVWGLLGLLGVLASCGVHGGAACERYMSELCDTCPKSEWQALTCKCLDEGTLTREDFPEGSGVTNDDAAQHCSRLSYRLKYPGPEEAASCRADLSYLREWDVDACEDLGWQSN